MSDSRFKPTIRVDLHTAMGDPLDARTDQIPDEDAILRMLEEGALPPVRAWHLLGYRRYLERDFRGAVVALHRAVLADDHHAESHFLKGICLQLMALDDAEKHPGFPAQVPTTAQGLLLKAEWAFRTVIELNPMDQEARTYLQGLEALLT